MNPASRQIEADLLARLLEYPEIELAGFSARAGLTGAGVTLMMGRTFFGSWRLTCGTLVWHYAQALDNAYFARSIDHAVYHTMRVILKHLELDRANRIERVA